MFLLKKITLWLALFGIVGVILLVRKTTTEAPMPQPPLAPAVKAIPRGISASGMVEALLENTAIGVPVAALVTHVHVKVWDKVNVGAPLLQLDDRELRAQLPALDAELRVQEAQLASTRRQSALTEALRANRVISADEADTRLDELAIQEARVASARAKLTQTQTLLERLTVRAPVAGTILQLNTRTGEYATPGSATPPLLLGAIDQLQLRADVDEQLATRVHPGGPATGYLKGDTQRPIPLTFLRIEPYVIPKRNLTGSSSERVDTRVLQVIYTFPVDPVRPLYVGQQMDLFIEETTLPPAAATP
ncbi:MAG: efflux RND transporter periplasmic adaptor subunit [Opitutus sp.]|nr:efflux RND transporter periplasmic adaptor subunit [Opitutus sp.]MCS6247608.1 efflux RND transporter periplasmic adaptor subunit [Opitutus sp.]MCS6273977.1 efflux RND transporter periplasmic adaptor subunit [Opitutus sp.]MCS6277705.1 efflux RND transporter periplasmic adaptor subunit [Opitutus sp.]MCS6299190.1 efflux RND transporter periplasmic adaptor subunit [Opitutus sp.]